VAAVALTGSGCDSAPAEVTPALESCTAAWQEIFGPRPYVGPSQILPRGDRVYFSDVSASGVDYVIDSLPATGGEASVVTTNTGAFLWAEGDNLLFAPWGDRLQAVPLAGGTATLIQDGQSCAALGSECGGLALDDQFLYFNIHAADPNEMVVRRMSRATGAEDDLATVLAGSATISKTRVVGDSLMVVGDHVYVVPRAGGPVRQLADAVGNMLGLDDQGALFEQLIPENASATQRAPIDGGPMQSFWTNKAARFRTLTIEPDPAGGWVAVGLEPFTDGLTHLSIWALDAQQKGTRVACDPRNSDAVNGDEEYSKVIVTMPDAIYAAVEHLTTLSWSLVRVAR
jgi:hypothetical protein